MKFSIDEILTLMDKMAETSLGELSIHDEDASYSLKLKAKKERIVCTQTADSVTDTVVTQPASSPAAAPVSGNIVNSPIVGTFYLAASPDKSPYVTVGKKVKKGDVLFIIESMKLMNEITSEFDGEVREILIENGSGVEYGQPILVIK